MGDGLDDVRLLLPGVRVERGDELGGSDRSEVRRLRARYPDGTDTSVVVKRFLGSGEGWVREAAALALLDGAGPAPRIVAEGVAPPLIVSTDLGTGGSVATALLADDPDAATEAVLSWARALAALHRVTLGRRDDFTAQLALRAGDLPVAAGSLAAATDDAVSQLESLCAQLGVSAPSRALSELRELPRRLGSRDPSAALTPQDACPDNNVQTQDGLRLIDFEGAEWRHLAWDVAYLTVPWATCWCSWRMPHDLTELAVEAYRAGIADDLPYVRSAGFRTDVAAAVTGWSVLSTTWFLPRALADDPPPNDPARFAPSRRATILHRLDGARRNTDLPQLAELATRLRDVLVQRWGEVTLAYAPAFGQ